MSTLSFRELIFRGRRKDNGEWIYGNYSHITRKCDIHIISDFEHNNDYEIYRESLQLKDYDNEFRAI